MKKFLLIILIPFFLGGCYDYSELNKLAIITAIGIDYVNDEYQVTTEILSTKKEGADTNSTKSYTVTKTGKNLVEALDSISNCLDRIIYYGHLEIVLIDEEIAKEHLDKVTDHLTRCPKLRNEFYSVIIKNGSTKEVLQTTTEQRKVVSSYLIDLMENSKDNSNASYYVPFTETLNGILSPGSDTMMSVFELKDKDLDLVGMGLFREYKLKTILDIKRSSVMNLLNNFNVRDITFSNSCMKDNYTVLSIYNGKTDISSNKNKIMVKASLEGWIKEENCNYNLREAKSYDDLQKIFGKVIKEEILKTIDEVKKSETNTLSLGNSYYINTRKKDYFKWLEQNVEVSIDLKINKEGLTFQIKEE